jgi:hypothetical protein
MSTAKLFWRSLLWYVVVGVVCSSRVSTHCQEGRLRRETIHVFTDSEGALHARHAFAFRRAKFLTLHYEITTPAARARTECQML